METAVVIYTLLSALIILTGIKVIILILERIVSVIFTIVKAILRIKG